MAAARKVLLAIDESDNSKRAFGCKSKLSLCVSLPCPPAGAAARQIFHVNPMMPMQVIQENE